MYKTKPTVACDMPDDKRPLKVLVLNASLKHKPEISNTEELSQRVLVHMKKQGRIKADIIRLADKNIPVGLKFRENSGDEWPGIAKKLREADVVIFATPIWWGGRSSLMQRAIERLDAFDEEYAAEGRSVFYNKVAGIVVTGSEDGALSVMGTIMMVLTWMGFTIPPECAAYWIGEVGQPVAKDREKRRKNKASEHMAANLARNLTYYARLLKQHPLTPKK